MNNEAFELWVSEARQQDLLGFAQSQATKPLRKFGTEYTGACPVCGGEDRFSVSTRKNIFNCRGAGKGGDVIALAQYIHGCDFIRACEILNGSPPPNAEGETQQERQARVARMEIRQKEIEAKRLEEEKKARAFANEDLARLITLYDGAKDPAGTAVEAYLRLRGLSLPPQTALRYVAKMPYYHGKKETSKGERALKIWEGAAMICPFVNHHSEMVGLHITWLDLNEPKGKKLLFDPLDGEALPNKKMRGQKKGGFLPLTHSKLAKPRDVSGYKFNSLVVGEGIETTLSAFQALEGDFDQAWAAGDIGNLCGKAKGTVPHPTEMGVKKPTRVASGEPDLEVAALPLPLSLTTLLIVEDGDSDEFTTDLAIERAKARYAREGLKVKILPIEHGLDANDYLMRRAK